MRVLVSGGRGFLGKHVVAELERRENEVYAPSSVEYDLRKPLSADFLLNDYPDVDAVVHLAARVGGIGDNVSRPGEFLFDNAMMGLQLMEAARVRGVSKFLTVGTACMYPANASIPMKESEIWNGHPSPETAPYAHAKRLLLSQGLAYSEQYDFNAVFVIPTNLYGPGDDTTHVVPQLAQKFSNAEGTGEDVLLWGSGSATRDFLYVRDAAEGVVAALDYYNEPWPVNLGSGVEVPIHALAGAIAYELGFEGNIRWDPTKPEGAARRCLDNSLAREKFGWTPKTRLREGLPKYLAWFEGSEDE